MGTRHYYTWVERFLIYSALTRHKETVEINSNAAHLMDGLADDYEYREGGLTQTLHKDKQNL